MRTRTLITKALFSKAEETPSPVSLPHTWNALDGQDGGDDYERRECTYRITLPAPTEGKRQFIEFLGVNHKATVSCGKREVGTHEGGFSTFRFELTEDIACGERDLTVKVSNEPSHIYPQRADFTFYGGIYREIALLEVEKAHISLTKSGSSAVFVTPNHTGRTRLDVFTTDAEGCQLHLELLDKEGCTVGETTLAAEEHSVWETVVPSPHLWHGIKDPYLYQARVSLLCDGELLDQVTERYGYRSYHVDPERGFFLNGKSFPLRGVCRHQDRENMGWAITEKEHREDAELIRQIGANTVRLAHYQHAPVFYDLCDEMGFCIWAEIPFISQFMAGDAAKENSLSQMAELITQNYNRPSIIVWGISNEIIIGPENEALYRNLCDLNALCKRLDPGRLTVMAQLSRTPYIHPHNTITDLVSYNNYYGWYRGATEDNGPKMDEFHALYPHKPYGLSEYGADHVITWHSARPFGHDYTEEYALAYHHHLLKCFETRPWIWATHVWNMFDFAADQRNEGGVKGRNCKGLITYDRKTKKDTFFLYQAYWSETPMVHIAGRRFADRAPDERSVTVYTNEENVTLILNGKEYATLAAEHHAVEFQSLPLLDGENILTARTASAEDTVTLYGVASHNTAYDVPDITAAMQAGNWFLQEDSATDLGDEGCSIQMPIKELYAIEECAQILRGWIMTCDALDINQKMTFCNKLPNWARRPLGQKSILAMQSFRVCSEEDFSTLDRKLRTVRKPK
ncbi:MAG: hypothetical protein IKC69_03935 [Clostridia bacterium]|nr:hypothetical protein [Clostridia bacterium]